MTLPASGPISLGDVNVELGLSATAQISMNDAAVRTLFGKASGAISMSDGRGKANQFVFAIASNQTNANLRTLAINAGWNGVSKVIATINSGVYISSNSTGTPALRVDGSFPNGVTLNNSGLIIGMGGAGGRGADVTTAAGVGGGGGGALSVAVPIVINNAGTIAGGGGGGGGGGTNGEDACGKYGCSLTGWGGGGGGGGRSSAAANSAGGASGTNAGGWSYTAGSGGGAGTASSAGGGGAGSGGRGGAGGAGGGWGASGSGGGAVYTGGFTQQASQGGGAGGYSVSGNGNITWTSTGTRLGGIS